MRLNERGNFNQETLDALESRFRIGSFVVTFIEHVESTSGHCDPELDSDQPFQIITCFYQNSSYGYYRSTPLDYDFVFLNEQGEWQVEIQVRFGRIAEYNIESERRVSVISEEEFILLRSEQIRMVRQSITH